MWKSPEETAIHVVNDISTWEDDVDTSNIGNIIPSNEIESTYSRFRQQQQIDVQYAIDRTSHLRKKLQLLVYLRHNHVEMVGNR